jgi:hypothetical protein
MPWPASDRGTSVCSTNRRSPIGHTAGRPVGCPVAPRTAQPLGCAVPRLAPLSPTPYTSGPGEFPLSNSGYRLQTATGWDVDHRCVLLGNARTIRAEAHYAIPAKSRLVSDNMGIMTVHAASWKALSAGCMCGREVHAVLTRARAASVGAGMRCDVQIRQPFWWCPPEDGTEIESLSYSTQ